MLSRELLLATCRSYLASVRLRHVFTSTAPVRLAQLGDVLFVLTPAAEAHVRRHPGARPGAEVKV